MAESFGTDASAYDAARPQYPEALVARIVAGLAGREVLDVGCGTGIAARQLQAADCTVLGVEPDPRMAGFARDTGVPVEVATFEEWDPRGRSFDAVIAAQSWHWVDPDAGPAKAAEVLRPGGRLAVFGHVFEPPATVAEAFAEAFRAAVPDSPFQGGPRPVEAYTSAYDAVAQRIHSTGAFEEPEVWRFDWRRDYTRDEWLALLPTTGGLTRVSPGALHSVLDAVGVAIDALGGAFTMEYATLGTAASRL
ncbi:class I SAM-dependent methyltransferase [Tsukamurella sp. 8F]|uniref:class I SAM-dependent methyltransferase n=1 Tax=unclassified Tsukamurella TaxID=2633480 RepID=UPI0023BA0AFD|nr:MULTISPECIES: class I SAM-dependent methyltransferase [unclassified Tsukamurella]MDF0531542.1 class I SAM-dependent methyltransferase [Tsukamurella sp. 8J]MDF0588846.1 class I SAM-dependent methyltransferase [Tsukamurella sp. 8F]